MSILLTFDLLQTVKLRNLNSRSCVWKTGIDRMVNVIDTF